jgi:hypothetical protein
MGTNDMNKISAKNTDLLDLDDIGPVDMVRLDEREWFKADIPTYEDDVEIDPEALDPFTIEQTDDASELFGVSPLQFGKELGRTAIDEGWDTDTLGYDKDDDLARVEDYDEDYDNAASAA